MVQSGGMVTMEESDDALAPGDPVGRLMQRIDAVKASFETFGASLGEAEIEIPTMTEGGCQPALAPAPFACWLRSSVAPLFLSHLPLRKSISLLLVSSQRADAFAGRSETTRRWTRRWQWRARSSALRHTPVQRDEGTLLRLN
jgi:hypothetical protein